MEINIQSGVTTYVGSLNEYAGSVVHITNSGDSVEYKVKYCGDYAAYYLGAKGGWGAFLFEGKCKRTDKVDRHSINKTFSNITIEFGEMPYISEITPEYELNTGWLTDAQSEMFVKDLLESNRVYLHDLADDRIFPVVITDSEPSVKKFSDENKLVSYKVNVKESQTRIRR